MRPFPGFDLQFRPYVLVKDRSGLTVVNLKSKQSLIIVRDCPYRFDLMRDYSLEVEMSDDEKVLEVFTILGE